MVSASTVQPSINLEFLFTYKNLKMFLYTLFLKRESTDIQIWKVMHEIIAEWWKNYVDPWSHYDMFWGLKAHCANSHPSTFWNYLTFKVSLRAFNPEKIHGDSIGVYRQFFHHSAIISCITFHIWKSVDCYFFNKMYRDILRFF